VCLALECFVIIKCTKFGQLIIMKMIKIVATRSDQISNRLLTGALCQTPLEKLTALPQTSYLDFRGPASKGGEATRKGGEGKEKGQGKEGTERRGFPLPLFYNLTTARNKNAVITAHHSS